MSRSKRESSSKPATGFDCFGWSCEPWEYNELAVLAPPSLTDWEFTFVDPGNPNVSTILPPTSGFRTEYIYKQYGYDDDCFLFTVAETNWGDATLTLAHTGGQIFPCRRLKFFSAKNFEYYFWKGTAPDLVESEAMSPPSGYDWSVKLNYVQYDW